MGVGARWRSLGRPLAFLALLSFAGEAAASGLERVEIDTASGTHVLAVEMARTPEELSRGLMGRRSLPHDQGMLFALPREQPVSMWMHDTIIPLDMIFISRQGVVATVKRGAQPMSEEVISSVVPVSAVLEVNAGVARQIGLSPGDVVRHPFFRMLLRD